MSETIHAFGENGELSNGARLALQPYVKTVNGVGPDGAGNVYVAGGGGGGTAPDATTTTKGVVQLAGDLGGTADAPTVPGLADKADAGHNHDGTYVKPADLPAPQTWDTLPGKPPVIAAGTSATAARDAIGAGTSNLQLGTGSTTAAAGNHTHDDRYVRTVNGTGPDASGDVEVQASSGGGAAAFPYPPITSGASHWWAGPAKNTTVGSGSDGQIVYCPLPVGRPVRITGFRCGVSTAGTGLLHVGLYGTVDGTDFRGAPLLATLLNGVAVDTTGEKVATGLTVDLPDPGLYWLAYLVVGGTCSLDATNDATAGLWIPHRAAGQTRVGGMSNGSGNTGLPNPATMPDTWDRMGAPVWYGLQTGVVS